jgi:hypothetical protein
LIRCHCARFRSSDQITFNSSTLLMPENILLLTQYCTIERGHVMLHRYPSDIKITMIRILALPPEAIHKFARQLINRNRNTGWEVLRRVAPILPGDDRSQIV